MVGVDEFKKNLINPRNLLNGGIEIFKNTGSILQGNGFISNAAIAALLYMENVAINNGINRVEFAFPNPYGEVLNLNSAVSKQVRRIMRHFNATVHLPMVMSTNLSEIILGMKYGIEHGAKQFVVHAADNEKLWPWQKRNPIEARAISSTNLEIVTGFAQKNKLTLGIENTTGHEPSGQEIDYFDYHFNKTDDQGVIGLCFDVAHFVSWHGTSEEKIVKTIELYKENLVEIHLTDTNIVGRRYQIVKHCALGAGKVELKSLLETLETIGFNGPIIVEVKNKDFEASWNWLGELGYV